MTTELTVESTHEDITAAVDAIIEDRKSTEEKGDAAKIAEERDKPTGDMTAEPDSGASDASEDTAPKGEDTGEDQKAKWLDDDLKAEITAYGIDENSLVDFTSREEVERAMRLFDKTALEAGRKALAEGEDGEKKTRDEKGRFQKTEEPKPLAEGTYEIGLDKDIYDDGLVDELTRMRDHYESRLSALETRLATQDAKADEQLFDSIVDSLGHGDLFGTSGKENSKQLQRRQDLHVSVKAQQIGLKMMGREVDLDQSLINRVARMVFAEELNKKDLKSRTRNMLHKTPGVGGGATRAPETPETLRDEFRRLYKEKEQAG